MTVPQFGIFAQGTIAHEFIEFDLRPDVDMARATTALSQLRAPAVAAGGVNLVIGFGAELWRTVAPDQAPADLANFVPIGRTGGHHAPATQHDFMRWVHDLDAFERLPTKEQERVFGRTKLSSIEMTDETLPPDAHIARVQINDEAGDELPIYRRSVPYGTVAEHGLYFVAFSADRTRFDRMLARMFGTDADHLHDHLTDFSRPVTGSFYFAPSLTTLAELSERWSAALDPVPMAEEQAAR